VKKQFHCIRCGCIIEKNMMFPYCHSCGGTCSANNRFSSIENSEIFCHICGEAIYVSHTMPVCAECIDFDNQKKQKQKKD
jgi:hypothetical protein